MGSRWEGFEVLWLHLIKTYCKSLSPTNAINALFCWFAYQDFQCLSWSIFIEDICTVANITETPQWKKSLAREGSGDAVHKLLCRTILPFYLYLYNYQPESFNDVWVADMVHPLERASFLEYVENNVVGNYL